MPQTESFAAPAEKPADLCNRKHTLGTPKGILGKSLIALQDSLESGVAKVSVHGDPPIYDSAVFPWAAEVESGWKKIRAELDQVMKYRDKIPSFHEILKEVTTITTDDQWKTFFLAGIGMNCEEKRASLP